MMQKKLYEIVRRIPLQSVEYFTCIDDIRQVDHQIQLRLHLVLQLTVHLPRYGLNVVSSTFRNTCYRYID